MAVNWTEMTLSVFEAFIHSMNRNSLTSYSPTSRTEFAACSCWACCLLFPLPFLRLPMGWKKALCDLQQPFLFKPYSHYSIIQTITEIIKPASRCKQYLLPACFGAFTRFIFFFIFFFLMVICCRSCSSTPSVLLFSSRQWFCGLLLWCCCCLSLSLGFCNMTSNGYCFGSSHYPTLCCVTINSCSQNGLHTQSGQALALPSLLNWLN